MKNIERTIAMTVLYVVGFSTTANVFAQTGNAPIRSAGHIVATNMPGIVSFKGPPTAFNPIAATDESVASYGLPPRPDKAKMPQAYALWLNLASAAQNRIENPLLEETDIQNAPARDIQRIEAVISNVSRPTRGSDLASSNGTPTTSTNWSGIVLTSASYAFTNNGSTVYTEFTVPTAHQPFGVCTGLIYHDSMWVGFDGYTNNDVFQTGIHETASCNSVATTATYYAWYEWYPNNEVKITSLPIHAGDVVVAQVWYTPGQNPVGHAYINNFSVNNSVSIGFNPPSGITYQGSTAEWIVEAPEYSGSSTNLVNYLSTVFSYAYASDGTNIYYPGLALPSGTAEYNLTMRTGGYNLSYPYVVGTESIMLFDEGPTECIPSNPCTNPGTNQTNTFN